MPRRSNKDGPISYRALTQSFRDYLTLRGGWPSYAELSHWGAKYGFGKSNGRYSPIKRGDHVDERGVAAFIATLLHAPTNEPDGPVSDPMRHYRNVLFDFLRQEGVPSPAALDLEAVMAHVCTAATDHRVVNRDVDWLKLHYSFMGTLLNLPLDASRYVRGCHPERPNELRRAVEDVYSCCGRENEPSSKGSSEAAAIRVAERVMTIGVDAYFERAAAWVSFNPWTVVRAWEGNKGVGALILLPLKPEAYEQILNGQRAGFELTPDDLTVPCRHLWMEACAEAPWAADDPKVNPTKALRACMMVQSGALVQSNKLPNDARLKVLTFSGTRSNRDRLLQNGFLPTGGSMARVHVALLAREFALASTLGDFMTPALLHYFGKLHDGPPPYHDYPLAS